MDSPIVGRSEKVPCSDRRVVDGVAEPVFSDLDGSHPRKKDKAAPIDTSRNLLEPLHLEQAGSRAACCWRIWFRMRRTDVGKS